MQAVAATVGGPGIGPRRLPEIDFLLLCGSLHQLQGSHHRALLHLQDAHLALCNLSCLLLTARTWSTAKWHRPWRGYGVPFEHDAGLNKTRMVLFRDTRSAMRPKPQTIQAFRVLPTALL